MKIKEFKNGNFNVKVDEIEPGFTPDLVFELCNSHELDFVIAGDEGCVSNYDMYYPLYNHKTDMLYYPTGNDCQAYAEGKSVKLVGCPITDEERKDLEGGHSL